MELWRNCINMYSFMTERQTYIEKNELRSGMVWNYNVTRLIRIKLTVLSIYSMLLNKSAIQSGSRLPVGIQMYWIPGKRITDTSIS